MEPDYQRIIRRQAQIIQRQAHTIRRQQARIGELGTRYCLKDALGVAAGINEYARQSDRIFMANYAQTVNVIGCIKTSKTRAALETTGLALKLYRRHFGTIPAATETAGAVNAQAAWTEDRKTLTVSVVNPTMQAIEIPPGGQGRRVDRPRHALADRRRRPDGLQRPGPAAARDD